MLSSSWGHAACRPPGSPFRLSLLPSFPVPSPSFPVAAALPQKSEVEEYEKALDLWHINGMQKATARLIEGLELTHKDGVFGVSHSAVGLSAWQPCAFACACSVSAGAASC